MQYWRSFADLERFARAADEPHLPAWTWFNRAVRASGDVGIWHETLRVGPGSCEAVYGNMPAVGLAVAGRHVPVGSAAASAARHGTAVGVRANDEPPVEGY